MTGLLILGDQLFPDPCWKDLKKIPAFMAEDYQLATHYKYHKHKLVFFFASMRRFAQEWRESGGEIEYSKLQSISFLERLEFWVKQRAITHLKTFEVDDAFFRQQIHNWAKDYGIVIETIPTPKFMTSKQEFSLYLDSHPKPFMKTFYQQQRLRTGLLIDSKGKPLGGHFSFDVENRKKLPKKISPPAIPEINENEIVEEVKKLVDQHFSDHPGRTENFWLATSREEAKRWAGDFFKNRMELFGDYEDAISPENDFVFHSVLSPYMNIGFLPPALLMAQIPKLVEKNYPLNSVEGFVRQVIGWREFVNGIYTHFDQVQSKSNFFKHNRALTKHWYTGTTGVLPLDQVIKKVDRLGYCHHIERLMVLSNMMLLSEIHPQEVYRWFMEMFVDSADWVMGPNVWGMGQFSDGGIFATKPYICGSNYVRKMSDYKSGDWCDVMDGLYWRFMSKHREFFTKNARMGAAMGTLDKMDSVRKEKIFKCAEDFLHQTTVPYDR